MGQVVTPVTLEKGLRAEFMKAYQGVPSAKLLSLMMQAPSSAASEKYGWLGSAPVMQKFLDEKMPKGLIDHDYTIKNEAYEATLGVDKFAIRNDQLGAVKVRIADMAQRAKVFPVKLLVDLIANGGTGLCYDGQTFFSAAHAEGKSGTQTNIVAGTGVTIDKIEADFNSARALMKGFKDDQAEPMFEGIDPKLLVVAPQGLEGLFEKLLNSTQISGTDNTLKGAAEFAVSSRLSGNSWYLFDISGEIKPFIFQENMPVEFGALEGNSETGFKKRHYLYGIEWYGNAGYGLWQKAIKVNQ